MIRAFVSILPLAFALASALPAQRTEHALQVGVGIDTSDAVIQDLVDTVRGYLATEGAGWKPSMYWRKAEQSANQVYDPAGGILGYSFPATVLQVSPAVPDESVYVIKLLFALLDSARYRLQPLAVQRFYAVRADSSWVLTSALARHTSDWHLTKVGRIHYRYPADYPFSHSRAERAAGFVDSLSAALEVPPPDSVAYYLESSSDEMARALGFDWLKLPSGPGTGRGGWAGGGNRIFSGDPRQGEEYRHELAHLIAGPLRSDAGRHLLVEEGFATWVGSTEGLTLQEGMPRLRAFAGRHPELSWRQLAGHSSPFDIRNLTGALLFDAVFRAAGWPGVRTLLRAGRSEAALFGALPAPLDITPDTFERWWRAAILETPAER